MKRYTLEELKVYWSDYDTRKCMRVLKNGKWEIHPLGNKPFGAIDGTKAEIAFIKKHKTFPEYLESL